MSDALTERIRAAEGYARRFQDLTVLEEYSPLLRELMLTAPAGTIRTLVTTDEGSVKPLSLVVSDARHRLEGWPGQPLRPMPARHQVNLAAPRRLP